MNLKPSHWLVVATAVAGSAVACGCYLLWQPAALRAEAGDSLHDRSPMPGRRTALGADPSRHIADSRRQTTEIRRAAAAAIKTRDAEPRKIVGSPLQSGTAPLSEAQWFARAARVGQEANHELSRLAGLLDLDSAQQDQLFAVLARQSNSWLPGMQPNRGTLGGTATPLESEFPSEADEVMAYLNADQQQTLIQEEMDRQAWWEEVLPQLLPPQLQDTTAPTATDSAPDTKPFEGNEVLLEE